MKKEWSRPGVLLVVLLLASTSSAINHTGLQTEEKPKLGCSSSEYHQFDFWIGDWDAFEKGGNDPVARLRVNRILDGCVLREDYQGQEGIKGESFAFSMHPGTFGIRPG